MKKSLSIFLASLLLVAATACSTPTNPTTTPSGDSGTTTGDTTTPAETTPAGNETKQETEAPVADEVSGDLYVWFDNEQYAEAVSAAFTDKYPNVAIEYEIVGTTDQRAKVTLDGPAGTGPDVFMHPHDGVALAINDGIVEPVPEDIANRMRGKILEPALETAVKDGVLYGIPYQTENIAFFYNKDLVDKAPETFEEVLEFAKNYYDPANNKYAMRWQINDAYHNYLFLTAFGFTIFGPEMNDYKQADWTGDAVAKGIEFHKSFRQYFDFDTNDVTWDSTVAAFQRGEVPFTITGPWAIADAKTNGVNFAVTKFPTINGVQPRCFSGAQVAHVSRFAVNKPAAFAFIEYMASEEGARVLYNIKGTLTALNDISGIEGLNDDPYLMGIQEQSPFSDPMPTIPEVDQMWEPLADLFTYYWNGQLNAEETQAKAMETYTLLLQAIGKSVE